MKKSIFLVLDNIRSLYNIGSLFRSADAFGVERIYLCGISGYPIHRQIKKIAKTALGAENFVPWEYFKSTSRLMKSLKEQGISIVSLETRGRVLHNISLHRFRPKFPIAIILGNEVKGLQKKILIQADSVVYIPLSGKKESLNVAVAGAIALYEFRKNSRSA